MSPTRETSSSDDPFQLARFVNAQQPVYATVLAELRNGQKHTHWMWYIFPQIAGLGHSPTAKHYAIQSAAEARHYLAHPILGPRLVECATTLLAHQGQSAWDIFGSPDDLKLKSSMTLFAAVATTETVFAKVLDSYFNGEHDQRTLTLLA